MSPAEGRAGRIPERAVLTLIGSDGTTGGNLRPFGLYSYSVQRIESLKFVRAAVAVIAILSAGSAPAQEPSPRDRCEPVPYGGSHHAAEPDGWNDPAVLRIVRSAIGRRHDPLPPGALRSYTARAEGHVFLYGDMGREAERQIRADQVALRVVWQAGRGSRQTIVGRRHVAWLPTDVVYHTDHLVLVLDGFADRIRLGHGDEVASVLNPLARGALDHYDYRLQNTFGIISHGRLAELYRLEVRPHCDTSAGVVGEIDIDRQSRTMARMSFTFTPASYVDPTIRGISVLLENQWMEGRHWLPAEQRIEIRRNVKWMDLPFGSTIRTRLKVHDYDLSQDIAYNIPPGDHILSMPRSVLERYAGWETGDIAGQPLAERRDSISMAEVRREARNIMRAKMFGGGGLKPWLPSVSDVFRVRRAEGVLVGAGLSYGSESGSRAEGWLGYPFGREQPEWHLGVSSPLGEWRGGLTAYVNRITDIGPFPAASGAIGTLGVLVSGDDYTDPYFRSGAAVSFEHALWTGKIVLRAVVEDQESATLVLESVPGDDLRPVRPIEPGTDFRGEIELEQLLGRILGSSLRLNAGAGLSEGGDFGYTRWVGILHAAPWSPDDRWQWEGDLGGGLVTGRSPPQTLFLVGGRGTIPGYEFRQWTGDRAVFASVALSRSIVAPWVRIRALGSAGWTDITAVGREAAARVGTPDTDGVRAALGVGLGLIYDVIRIDVAYGLDPKSWGVLFSVNPAFRAPL